MRHLILTAMCFLSIELFSQGNLEFSQVVTITESFVGGNNGFNSWLFIGAAVAVPEGKVWKIEKFSANTSIGSASLRFNDLHDMSVATLNSGPTWLKAGDYIKPVASCSGCGALSGSYLLSIIEFNVLP